MTKMDLFVEKYIPEPMSGCWLWTATIDNCGYGMFGTGGSGKTTRAHRWSYANFVGEIPKGKIVCHRCDNPSCVNPNHLFIGTNLDNATDRGNKNRTAVGIRNGKSKLSEEQVLLIKQSNLSERKLAKEIGINRSTINAIRSGRTWRHING